MFGLLKILIHIEQFWKISAGTEQADVAVYTHRIRESDNSQSLEEYFKFI